MNCALDCGRVGTEPLFEGERLACAGCMKRATELAVIRRDLKKLSREKKQARVTANALSGGRIRSERPLKLSEGEHE